VVVKWRYSGSSTHCAGTLHAHKQRPGLRPDGGRRKASIVSNCTIELSVYCMNWLGSLCKRRESGCGNRKLKVCMSSAVGTQGGSKGVCDQACTTGLE